MLSLIYTDLHQLWQALNELYHASTLKRWEQDKHRRLAATITFLHTLKPKALARDRDGLFIPDFMSELPTYTSAYMESWIRQYDPAIRASVQEATSQLLERVTIVERTRRRTDYGSSESNRTIRNTNRSYDRESV